MGTNITVLTPRDDARADASAIEMLFAEWDRQLSRFRPDSDLARLNAAAGAPHRAGKLLLHAATTAIEAAAATDGLFDPLLGGRMEELGYDRTFDALPSDAIGAPLHAWRPDEWRRIAVDQEHKMVTLPTGGRLDLGGIAKGMAVDAALARLVDCGLSFAAVNAGGDLAVHGEPPDEHGWEIAIEGSVPRQVSLRSGALATSSVERRRWQVNGRPRHHLLDPRTGMPATTGLRSVSVAAATCQQAEVAAKAALLLGRAAGSEFLLWRGMSGLLVTDGGDALRIGAWQ
jgi:FAD:protein FMN transferase